MRTNSTVRNCHSLLSTLYPGLGEDGRSLPEVLDVCAGWGPHYVKRFHQTIQELLFGLDEQEGAGGIRHQMLRRAQRMAKILSRFCMLPMKEQRVAAMWKARQATPPFREQIVTLDVLPGQPPVVAVQKSEDLFEAEPIFDWKGVGFLEVRVWELDVELDAYRAAREVVMKEYTDEIVLPGVPHTANDDQVTEKA